MLEQQQQEVKDGATKAIILCGLSRLFCCVFLGSDIPLVHQEVPTMHLKINYQLQTRRKWSNRRVNDRLIVHQERKQPNLHILEAASRGNAIHPRQRI